MSDFIRDDIDMAFQFHSNFTTGLDSKRLEDVMLE